jgi:DNA phosphorothioation-associated putative methyltransferase
MRIERHRTAIRRTSLSRPVSVLVESGLLSPDTTFLDYGCGLGDDVRLLQRHGYQANGWDPYYAPDGPRTNHDIVNLGFVLNVIEHPDERAETLRAAFSMADKCLAVAVMPDIDANRPDGVPFRDGLVTIRTTFQRLYTQDQLSDFVHSILSNEPVSISPGIVLIFKSTVARNSFRYRRLRGQRDGINLSAPVNAVVASQVDEIAVRYPDEWNEYLQLVSERGRPPDLIESRFARLCADSRIRLEYAFERARLHLGTETINGAAQRSKDTIIVFLAMSQFNSKIVFSDLPDEIQRDVRTLFGSMKNANAAARDALLSLADLSLRHEAAVASGLSVNASDDHLIIDPHIVDGLPLPLRLYVELGSLFLGAPEEAERIKIHLRSNKLTFLYDAKKIGLQTTRDTGLSAKLDFTTRRIATYFSK